MRLLAVLFLLTGACFIEPPRPGDGSGGDGGNGSGGTPNRVFVTSMAQAVGAFGSLDAADALCNRLAMMAGVPGTYVAWLSSSTTSAKLRLGNARGWLRMDDLPFADTIEDLVAGKIWYPPRIDELGHDHPLDTEEVATATHPDGSSDVASTCSDFTTTSLTTDLATGAATGGSGGWTSHDTAHCGTPTHLYCFGIDHQSTVPAPSGTGRLAFLTSQTISGAAGRDKADLECTNEATSQGLSGPYLALMATSTEAAASRFTTSGMAWYRPDGVKVTDDLVNLTAPIDVSAANQYISMGQSIFPWTGATSASSMPPTTSNCTDWTAMSGTGINGDASVSSSSKWFDGSIAACSVSRAVYCLQQ